MDRPLVDDYWGRHPRANVGILLEPSKLVVIDLDGREAIAEARQKGLPDTATVETGKGLHLYYRRPDDYPVGRAIQRGTSKLIDVLSRGYAVAPPSAHRGGHVYSWAVAPENLDKLPPPPWWTRKLFPKKLPKWMQKHGTRTYSKREFNPNSASPEIVRTALLYIEPDDYSAWLQVGFALQMWDDAGDGRGKGFEFWDDWSRKNSKYPGSRAMRKKWASFRQQRGVGLGTLFSLAQKYGWTPDDRFKMPMAAKKGKWFS
jgi:hypothetical protein